MGVSTSWYICRTISAVSSLLWLFMSHNTSIARLRANSLAKSRPRPLPAPVITHTCPATLFSLGRTTHLAPAVTKAQSTFKMTTKNSAIIIIILANQFKWDGTEEAQGQESLLKAACGKWVGSRRQTWTTAQTGKSKQRSCTQKWRKRRKAGAQLNEWGESWVAAQPESSCHHSLQWVMSSYYGPCLPLPPLLLHSCHLHSPLTRYLFSPPINTGPNRTETWAPVRMKHQVHALHSVILVMVLPVFFHQCDITKEVPSLPDFQLAFINFIKSDFPT